MGTPCSRGSTMGSVSSRRSQRRLTINCYVHLSRRDHLRSKKKYDLHVARLFLVAFWSCHLWRAVAPSDFDMVYLCRLRSRAHNIFHVIISHNYWGTFKMYKLNYKPPWRRLLFLRSFHFSPFTLLICNLYYILYNNKYISMGKNNSTSDEQYFVNCQ